MVTQKQVNIILAEFLDSPGNDVFITNQADAAALEAYAEQSLGIAPVVYKQALQVYLYQHPTLNPANAHIPAPVSLGQRIAVDQTGNLQALLAGDNSRLIGTAILSDAKGFVEAVLLNEATNVHTTVIRDAIEADTNSILSAAVALDPCARSTDLSVVNWGELAGQFSLNLSDFPSPEGLAAVLALTGFSSSIPSIPA